MVIHCLPTMPFLSMVSCAWYSGSLCSSLWTVIERKTRKCLLGCSTHFLANVDIRYSVVLPIFPI